MVGGAGTATYQWYASASTDTTAKWVEIEGEDDATLSVTASLKDKFIKVVVTDEAGNEAEDETLTKVSVDASFDVELVDDHGLQSDGTGIIGDQLTVTYGATFGVPTNVSWYKDGKVVATNSVGDRVNDGLTREITASNWGTGVYKVTITNTNGDIAETNEITITDKEEAAEILDFTLEDDYTDGTDLHYDTTDQRAVATVTLNKAYVGQLTIYKATDTKFANPIAAADRLTTATGVAQNTAAAAINIGAAAGTNDGNTIMTSNQATNYQVLNTVTGAFGRGYGYINPDGTVVYKWVLDDAGVLRGTDYVVCFNQASISTDTPGTGIANVSEATTAPYVEAPDSLAVTKVSNGSRPEVTFLDAEGNELAWFGYEAGTTRDELSGGNTPDQNNIAINTTTQLESVGLTEAQIYGSTNKTNDPKASGVSILATGVTNRVTNAADDINQGVWTTPAGVTAGDAAYWFATATLKKGIFGAEKIELVSEPADSAQDAATDIDLVESKTAATMAVVKFSNLRSDGTVYIVQGDFQGTAAAAAGDHRTRIVKNDTTVAAIFEKFDENDPNTYTAKERVTAGTASVEVTNAISSNLTKVANTAGNNLAAGDFVNGNIVDADGDGDFTDETWALTADVFGNDHYIAVFIPDDQTNYGMVYTDGAFSSDSYTSADNAKSGLRVTQAVTTVDKSNMKATVNAGTTPAAAATGTINLTIDDIVLKDQFGTAMVSAAADTSNEVTAETSDLVVNNAEATTATSSINTRGVLTITAVITQSAGNGADTFVDKGEFFTYNLKKITGASVVVTFKHAATGTDTSLSYDATDAVSTADAANTAYAKLTTAVAAGQTTKSTPKTLGNVISVS